MEIWREKLVKAACETETTERNKGLRVHGFVWKLKPSPSVFNTKMPAPTGGAAAAAAAATHTLF